MRQSSAAFPLPKRAPCASSFAPMKSRNLLLTIGLIVVVFIGVQFVPKAAQPSASSHNWECAMIKWDGPDKLAIIYPDHAEMVRVFKSTKLPPDMTEEEFCLTWGA